jgi:hypothetical protein
MTATFEPARKPGDQFIDPVDFVVGDAGQGIG